MYHVVNGWREYIIILVLDRSQKWLREV